MCCVFWRRAWLCASLEVYCDRMLKDPNFHAVVVHLANENLTARLLAACPIVNPSKVPIPACTHAVSIAKSAAGTGEHGLSGCFHDR